MDQNIIKFRFFNQVLNNSVGKSTPKKKKYSNSECTNSVNGKSPCLERGGRKRREKSKKKKRKEGRKRRVR